MDLPERAYRTLSDEANRTLLLFSAASVLGVASVAGFVLKGGGRVTRAEFGLLVAAMALVFYLLVRTSTFQ